MKFCKKYQEYMQKREMQHLPGLGFKRFKKILKKCREEHQIDKDGLSISTSSNCPVCDGTFFPMLLKEMSAVACCFNHRAQKLLKLHLATGMQKCMLLCINKVNKKHIKLAEEGKDLVTYATVNAIAVRKILKKYDKVHRSMQGQAFKMQAQNIPGLLDECSVKFDDGKPSLSCVLFDSVQLEMDLTCSICLDTVFDPVSLTCSHILCYMCACSAASVTIVDGLKAADPRARCPLCRKGKVYEGAVHLEELSILLSRSCPEYWEERLKRERTERIKQAKRHWETQCRAFMGV